MKRGVAVVAGGSAGLGRATVRELAARGWDVAVIARGEDALSATVAEVRALGRRALAVSADVTDGPALEAAAERIETELGLIELWVNDAMTGVLAEFLDTDPADFERVTAVNYLGVVNGTRTALKRMVSRDRGHVIQVGSALAHRGIPLQAAYCGAKHAVAGFTESVVAELRHRRSAVRVSIVDMPALNTIQFAWVKSALPSHPQPVPPIFEPEVGARAIAAVAERPRARTWVGEPTVATVLGGRFASRFMDWYLARTAYSGQQAPDVDAPMLPPNLYEPVPGDHGARGEFSYRAHTMTPQIWAISHRRQAAGIAAGLGAAAAVVAVRLVRRG